MQKIIFSFSQLFNFDLKIGTCGSRRPNSIGVVRFASRITVHPARPQISLLRLIISCARADSASRDFSSSLSGHPGISSLRMRSTRSERATFNFSPTTLTHFSSRPGTSYRATFFLTIAARAGDLFAGRAFVAAIFSARGSLARSQPPR